VGAVWAERENNGQVRTAIGPAGSGRGGHRWHAAAITAVAATSHDAAQSTSVKASSALVKVSDIHVDPACTGSACAAT
jgi:hypothetical protein